MANLTESSEYTEGIYQLETTTPALGGPPNLGAGLGLMNVQAQQLAGRTGWLKAQVESLLSSLTSVTSGITAANANANARAPATRSIATAGLATGGGDLTANRTITVPIATGLEARAGESNAGAMTPIRTADAINYQTLGRSQVWRKPTRARDTWIQNTSARPIFVLIVAANPHVVRIGTSPSDYIATTAAATISFIVPVSHYYMVTSGSGAIDWSELREPESS